MSLGFLPSYSNFPMYHRNDKLLTVRIILIFTSKIRNPPKRVFHPSRPESIISILKQAF